MRLSEIAVGRPVLATVMNLLIVVAGAVAYLFLPVREYPDVDVPVISVTTAYPGAGPLTVEATITEPIEQVLNGIEGIRSISSTSAFSVSSINVELDVGRSLDTAATDVSNALQQALGQLPPEAERPLVSKAGGGDQAIIWISVIGEGHSAVERTDIADRIVKTPLQLLPGVARVLIGGERRYAMRIWLDPVRMANLGVDASDVRQAVRDNNLRIPAGELEGATRKFTLEVEGDIDDPRIYERLVIRRSGERTVRIGDVGRVELGSANYQTITRSNGRATVGVGIIRQSNANEVEVSRAVREALPAIRRALPDGVSLEMATDSTIFVEASLRQVWVTLAIVFALVVLVNLVFLRSPTTTGITALSIPVSLIGTFAVMQALGFSINVLTALALVLAIGLLVDDSIVVLENVYRRRELGESRLQAARRGSREVAFPVIATTAAVVAVLIPLSLMTGGTGRLFREFAISMAAAVIISTFVALTLVPMLSSRFLRVQSEHTRLFYVIEAALDGTAKLYRRALAWCLLHRRTVGAVFLASLVGTPWLYVTLPSTLVPTEDRGSFITFIRAPQGATASYTDAALRQVEERISGVPEVEAYFAAVALGFVGQQDTSQALVFTRLKHWNERQRSQQAIVGELAPSFFAIPQALVFAINPPSLGQNGRNADVQVVLKSSDATLTEFQTATRAIVSRLRAEVPGLANVDSDARLESPQLDVALNRERAADLGIPVRSVAENLRLLVSEGPSDEFILRNKQYDVVLALEAQHRSVPEQLGQIHIRSGNGTMIPLETLIQIRPTTGPASLNHYDLQRSATITGNLDPGATLGDVLRRVNDIIDQELPQGFSTGLGGVSREYVESSGILALTFAGALLIIYLVLAAQFESFLHPLTVMLSVPLASLGAFATLHLTGHTLNLYSSIGLILLVGLVTKNSILLVDFANQERARGRDLIPALREAGRTRFRPILMTSMTSILGAVPLATAFGAGAESRRPIGAAIVGGLLFSTIFTLLVIPVVHYTLIRLGERLGLRTIPPLVELESSTA